jgi:hypothetical protein
MAGGLKSNPMKEEREALYFFRIYGLNISSNREVSWFKPVAKLVKTDWDIHFKTASDNCEDDYVCLDVLFYASRWIDLAVGKPQLVIKTDSTKQIYHFSFSDGVDVLVNNLNSQIIFQWPPAETLEYELGYLVACIMSFILLLREIFSFHASAIGINDKAIVLVGDSGAGKSTTAAAFAKLGYPVLSDDLVALRDDRDRCWVQPAFPMIRLWEKSVVALFGRTDALPEIVPNRPLWNKQYLNLERDGYQFQDKELSLGGIYFLSSRSSDCAKPYINPISSQEALLSLVANNYSAHFMDKASRAKEFEMLGRILQKVPARQVTQSNDISHISYLCEAILTDFDRSYIASGIY